MNIFDKIQQQGFELLEAFKDLSSQIEDLKNDRGNSGGGFSVSEDELSEPLLDGPVNQAILDEYALDAEEDFPEVKSYCFEDLDPEDPAFRSGKEIGIPYAVAVRTSDGQSKLLPIKNGLFSEE